AHNTIYTGKRGSTLGILRFFTQTYPEVFSRNFPYVMAAFIIFAAGSVAGLLTTLYNPNFQLQVLGPEMVDTIEHHRMWTHSVVAIKPVASSAIMTNNLSVTFMTFAMGITAGLGTLYMIFFNGLLLGVVGTACWLNQMSLPLWSFVAPHGVLELPSIFIAGGAGLRLAQGMLFPGTLSRQDSLAKAGGEAVRLLVGIIPILIVAGLIEGFISPSSLPWQWKFSMAGAVAVIFFSYLFFCARGGDIQVNSRPSALSYQRSAKAAQPQMIADKSR